MKKLLSMLFFLPNFLFSQENFDKFFSEGSLRVDFVLAGNNLISNVYIHSFRKEPFWGGSHESLIDTFEFGSNKFEVWSVNSDKLIYSQGFCTLFDEWKTTPEAQSLNKGFYQTVTFPFPKEPVRFIILERDRKGMFRQISTAIINPQDYFIQPSNPGQYRTVNITKSGDPAKSVDIVFLPEGYSKNEMKKFIKDTRRLCDSLFLVSPFREFKDKFNLYAILCPSVEQGTDIPGNGIWKNTIMNSSFFTFNNERYLTTQDYWKVRDLAALVPYDQICILVNTSKYGGGGIYNHYNLTSVDHKFSLVTFVHEFGHSMGALGDEYYTSDVTYDNFYPLDIEPWEPNLTTLVNFDKKWKSYLSPGIPVPTPEIETYDKSIGVFEGGGYSAKGIYRPQINCLMKSSRDLKFCEVCQNNIEKIIQFLTH